MKTLVVHSDSVFYVARMYNENATNWSRRLFPEGNPPLMQALLSDDYINTQFEQHGECVKFISASLSHKPGNVERYGRVLDERWISLMGWQNVRTGAPVTRLGHLRTLADNMMHFVGMETPALSVLVGDALYFWRGNKCFIEGNDLETINIESYFAANYPRLRSHAFVHRGRISSTLGTQLEPKYRFF